MHTRCFLIMLLTLLMVACENATSTEIAAHTRPDLRLAYSTAEGLFLWNARTGEHKQIGSAPVHAT
jgi:hypothetical protein